MIVSEHRMSYSNTQEMCDDLVEKSDITLYSISSTRFEVHKAAKMLDEKGVKCNIIHIVWLKPFTLTSRLVEPLVQSKKVSYRLRS